MYQYTHFIVCFVIPGWKLLKIHGESVAILIMLMKTVKGKPSHSVSEE